MATWLALKVEDDISAESFKTNPLFNQKLAHLLNITKNIGIEASIFTEESKVGAIRSGLAKLGHHNIQFGQFPGGASPQGGKAHAPSAPASSEQYSKTKAFG